MIDGRVWMVMLLGMSLLFRLPVVDRLSLGRTVDCSIGLRMRRRRWRRGMGHLDGGNGCGGREELVVGEIMDWRSRTNWFWQCYVFGIATIGQCRSVK